MKIFALCSLLLAPGMANAQSFEANLSSALLGTSDMDFSNFSYGYVMPAHGVDVGFEVAKNLNVLVGFHTGTVGTDVFTDGDDNQHDHTSMSEDEYYEYEYDYDPDPSFRLASTVNQVTAGVRYRFDWTKRLKVTVTGQGIFAQANLRLDEDTDMEGSEVAVQYNAMAPGLLSTAGLEWAPLVTEKGRINIGVEAGYGHILAFNFKEKDASKDPISVGTINLNGQFLRGYIGTRF
jgi:hypothetical protein